MFTSPGCFCRGTGLAVTTRVDSTVPLLGESALVFSAIIAKTVVKCSREYVFIIPYEHDRATLSIKIA